MTATTTKKKSDAVVRSIYTALKETFPLLGNRVTDVVYRYNSAAIRVRLVDERFRGKSLAEREEIAMRALKNLKRESIREITMLLTLTPEEAESPDEIMNREFLNPDKGNL